MTEKYNLEEILNRSKKDIEKFTNGLPEEELGHKFAKICYPQLKLWA